MTESGKKLIEFLEKPEAFPHQPAEVKHIQTHISHVFMASPFVYKIKKPVDFGFLDYSNLNKRKHFCEREVSLNRRLCSEIYLDVLPIKKNEDTYILNSDGTGEIIEYAVKMKELEERFFLHNYIKEGRLDPQLLERVAHKLSEFYNTQEPSPEVLKYGDINQVQFNTDENFKQTKDFVGITIDPATYKAVKYFTEQYLSNHAELFRRRVEEERIVDGHGDLHLEHIHITPDRVCIYDCIEFNERFRCGDQAVDLAFLAMDLDFQNCWKEGRAFMELMATKLDDPELPLITDFYKCYRAYVKGKVKSLQSTEEEVEAGEREEAAAIAQKYFGLSLRYALLGSKPWVLVFMGRVGTGKSTLAEAFSNKFGIKAYSSDRIRKTLAGLPLEERTPVEKRKDLYSSEMSEQTYRQLIKKAEEHAGQGRSVILDATFSSLELRGRLMEKLVSAGVKFLFIEAFASEETVKKRLKLRENKNGVVSDARVEDFAMLQERYEPPNEIDPSRIVPISTEATVEETFKDLYKEMVDLQFLY